MLISRDREKLINAVVYFASNTRHCGKVKLFKLLYLLDFAHFRETGRSVTGLDYLAWKMGPVPFALMQEWDELESDMAKAVSIVPEKVIDFIRERVVPNIAFDDSLFTRRELRLMKEAGKYLHFGHHCPGATTECSRIGTPVVWEAHREWCRGRSTNRAHS